MTDPKQHGGDPAHHPPDDLGFDLPAPPRVGAGKAIGIVVVLLIGIGIAFVAGYLPKRHARAALEEDAKSATSSKLRVQVVTPKLASSDRAITIPGSIQPLEETTINSRAAGYVRNWFVDIGDKVTEGQLLCEIETPELNGQILQAQAQLAQAEAGVVQAKANSDYSRVTLKRDEQLTAEGISSQQELEKSRAQAVVDEANVSVARATAEGQRAAVQHLLQLKAFSKVTAPFKGTITARTVERGALVGTGADSPLFRVAANDPVRVFLSVPQDVAPTVKIDMPAAVSVREFPGRTFDGKVARTSGALDPATRTMTTEVRIPNPKGELLAGMYTQVALKLPTPHRVFELPATALLNDAGGLRIAVVDAENKIHLVTVALERDTGPTVEIASGIDGTERIVRIAGPEHVEGREVEVAKDATTAQK